MCRESQVKTEQFHISHNEKQSRELLPLSDCLGGGPYKLNGILKIKIAQQREGMEGVSGDRTIDPKIYSN